MVNNGPLDLPADSGAQVIDDLPTGLEFVSATDCVNNAGQVICQVGALLVGGSQTFTIVTRVPADYAGSVVLVNEAVVDLPGDTDPGNNDDDTTTRVPPAPTAVPVDHPLALLALLTGIAGFAGWRLRRGRSAGV